jgi:hypothetical protein
VLVGVPEGERMKYHLLTAFFLLAAIACYFAGLATSAAVLVVLGLVLEVVFWIRLLVHPTSKQS